MSGAKINSLVMGETRLFFYFESSVLIAWHDKSLFETPAGQYAVSKTIQISFILILYMHIY